jgi:D-alanyl-D-alanine dipeptidase
MTDAGFTNMPTKWWHYDYGNKFWAYYTKEPAKYGCEFG